MVKKKHKVPLAAFFKKRPARHPLRHGSFSFVRTALGHNRFGVVVTAKAYPKATERNYIKRQLYDTLNILPERSVDVSVSITRRLDRAEMALISKEIFEAIAAALPSKT